MNLYHISQFSCLYIAEPFFKWYGVEKLGNHLSFYLLFWLLSRQSSDFSELNVLAQIFFESFEWLALVKSSIWKELEICAPDLLQAADTSALGKRRVVQSWL